MMQYHVHHRPDDNVDVGIVADVQPPCDGVTL